MKLYLARLGATLALCLLGSSAFAAGLVPISQVFVFGDSLSDNGNAFALTSGAYPNFPYFPGRVSNGLVWAEPMASDLGVVLTNYAVAGAQTGTGNVNADDFPTLANTGLLSQVGQFASDLGAGMPDTGAIYVVFAGANNFCADCFGPGDDPVPIIQQGVMDVLTAVGTLQAIGAQKFVVFGLPDLGVTPRAIAAGQVIPGIEEQLSLLTDAWNAALFTNLAGLFPTPADQMNLVTIDIAQILRTVVQDPGAFGFTNVTEACLAVGCNTQTLDPALDPDGFLFWDDIHPTRATHALLADIVYEAVLVPVPPAILMFFSAIGLLAWLPRRAVV